MTKPSTPKVAARKVRHTRQKSTSKVTPEKAHDTDRQTARATHHRTTSKVVAEKSARTA